MKYKIDYRKAVRYELMRGREATQTLKSYPVGYLPIGCLERHGDHLPMGLDVLKAHRVCCLVARAIGGVVFPPHFYAGIHQFFSAEEKAKYTGQWGNIYTDESARNNLVDIINQIELTGVRVLVLYSGHYPQSQVEMVRQIAAEYKDNKTITVIPFCECMIMTGDHAGICETSFMLYLDRSYVDMTRIGSINYQEHGWNRRNSPEGATARKGEQDVEAVITHLKSEIERTFKPALRGKPIK